MKTDIKGRMQLLIEVTAANLKRRLRVLPFDRERANDTVYIAEQADLQIEEIDHDPNLSPDGRLEYTLRAVRSAHAMATTWGEEQVGAYDSRIKIETAALLATPARPKDPVVLLTREVRLQEIREPIVAALRAVDPILRPALIGRIYAEGDADVRAAIAEAPQQVEVTGAGALSIGPLIPPALIEEFALGAAELSNPEAVAQLRDLSLLRDAFKSIAETLKTALSEAVRAPLDGDDVAEMAAGLKPVVFPLKRR
jgi:hypothetical protein